MGSRHLWQQKKGNKSNQQNGSNYSTATLLLDFVIQVIGIECLMLTSNRDTHLVQRASQFVLKMDSPSTPFPNYANGGPLFPEGQSLCDTQLL